MGIFRVPKWVNEHTFEYDSIADVSPEKLRSIKKGLKQFNTSEPKASLLMPAYNEEAEIIRTLSSLSKLNLPFETELIISNNNSTDSTQEILDELGVRSLFVKEQGVSYARQAGIEEAKGEIIISCDADSIYPPLYGLHFYNELKNNSKTGSVYGRYSFIPSDGHARFPLFLYEQLAEVMKTVRKRKEEAINVLGFTFAYRRQEALDVGGFNHKMKRGEDGSMAGALRDQGYGAVVKITHPENHVWTSDRRLMENGTLANTLRVQAKREMYRWKRI